MANTKVTTGVIKDDAVGADQLASNAVVTASITDNAVTTAKISDDAILTAKISNSAITNAKMSANSVDSDQYVDASIDTAHIRDGQITSAKLDTNISVSGELTVGSHLNMGDGDILKMGASADLQIYHHSNGNSIISETGSGDLFIQATNVQIENAGGDNMIVANSGGAVNLYYAAAEKLATTSSGVDVTGTATMGGLTVQGTNSGVIVDTSTAYAPLIKPSGALSDLKLSTVGNGGILHLDSSGGSASTIRMTTNGSERMRIDGSGNVGIGCTPTATANVTTLEISNSTTARILVDSTGTGGRKYGWYSSTDGQFAVYDYDASAERMRISSSGQVSIGTTSTTAPLRVKVATDANFAVQNTSSTVQLQGINDAANAFATIDIAGNPIKFSANGSESMRIDSSGNVGIAAVPSGEAAAAHVVRLGDQVCIAEYDDGSNPEQFNLFHNSDSAETYIETGTASVIQQRAGEIIFKNAASGSAGAAISFSERMRIDSSGNLLVGTTTAGAKFHVNGGGGSYGQCFLFDGFGYGVSAAGSFNHTASLPNGTATGDIFYFQYQGTNVGEIDITTTATNYRTSSDYRLKENVDYEFNALNRVAQLKPARFNFIADESNNLIDGFLAHEVQDIVPNAVAGEKDGEKMQSIDHSKLVPLLTKAIQEQQAQIETLKQEIQELKE